ncbi:hypothetical protein Tco_0732131 [Tanacetum coccineum]
MSGNTLATVTHASQPTANLVNTFGPAQALVGHSSPPGFPQIATHVNQFTPSAQHTSSAHFGGQSAQQEVLTASHETLLPNAFNAMTPQDPVSGNWNKDTSANSHVNDSVSNLSNVFNFCIYPSIISVGDGHSIPVTNSGHSILPTPHQQLHLKNVLITHNIVKNLIYVRHFVRDNLCTIEFDHFGFSVKDFMTRWVLLRYDITGDLYPVTKPSSIPHAFLTSQYT